MTFSDEAVEAAARAYEDSLLGPFSAKIELNRNNALERRCTAMRAALTALEPYLVPEWKDIASAPWYDGARVIVSDGRYVGQGEWLVTEGCWIGCDGICPTVWQPLPAPPDPFQGGGE